MTEASFRVQTKNQGRGSTHSSKGRLPLLSGKIKRQHTSANWDNIMLLMQSSTTFHLSTIRVGTMDAFVCLFVWSMRPGERPSYPGIHKYLTYSQTF